MILLPNLYIYIIDVCNVITIVTSIFYSSEILKENKNFILGKETKSLCNNILKYSRISLFGFIFDLFSWHGSYIIVTEIERKKVATSPQNDYTFIPSYLWSRKKKFPYNWA